MSEIIVTDHFRICLGTVTNIPHKKKMRFTFNLHKEFDGEPRPDNILATLAIDVDVNGGNGVKEIGHYVHKAAEKLSDRLTTAAKRFMEDMG